MMKQTKAFFAAFILLILFSTAHSQQITVGVITIDMDHTTGKYATRGVVGIDSVNKDILLEGAYNWLVNIKYSESLASKGINMDESALHKIIVNQYLITSKNTASTKIRFILTLEFRDGRFKYTCTDFAFYNGYKYSMEELLTTNNEEQRKLRQPFLYEIAAYLDNFMVDLRSYLLNYKPDLSW
jgi:hypothetical protein